MITLQIFMQNFELSIQLWPTAKHVAYKVSELEAREF